MEFARKNYSGRLHTHPKPCTKYKNHSLSGFLDTVLTMFTIAIQSQKKWRDYQYCMEFTQKLIGSSTH